MKKHEWIGLSTAVLLIFLTYAFNLFENQIERIFRIEKGAVFSAKKAEASEPEIFHPLVIKTSKKNYYRYELIDISAVYKNYNRETITSGVVTAKIYLNNKLIHTITEMKEITLKFNPETGSWEGKWPIPWNPSLGEYQLLVMARPANPGPVLKETVSFNIIGKDTPAVSDGLCVMALETQYDVSKRNIIGPDGQEGDWKNIIQWAKYMGADAIFSLAGMSDGNLEKNGKLPIFRRYLMRNAKKLAAEANRNGIQFGAWVQSFMLNDRNKNFEDVKYQPSIGYDSTTGRLLQSYHISMGDEKRIQDLIAAVKDLDSSPNIDFIGIDYIRSGHADGYEMVEEIVEEMSIQVPDNWKDIGPRERIIWFARKIEVDKNADIIEKWRWWRAHKSATIVRRIIEESGTQKPIWLYTLGWEHGKQHGQDPIMFNDAGITYDAVMLYEANSVQFRKVLIDWKAYLRSKQVNVMCGNSVDIKLLDSTHLTPPEEIVRRTIVGSQKLLFGGLTSGVFWHDLSRALWGRKGEYSEKEWCITGGTVFSKYRAEMGLTPISLTLQSEDYAHRKTPFEIKILIENISLDTIKNIKIAVEEVEGIQSTQGPIIVTELAPGEKYECVFTVQLVSVPDQYRTHSMIPVKVNYNGDKVVFDFHMVSIVRPKPSPAGEISSENTPDDV